MRNSEVPTRNSVDRRTVLASTLTAASALALGGAATASAATRSAATEDRSGKAGELQTDTDHLRLTLKTVPKAAGSGEALAFTISTTNTTPFSVDVSTTNSNVTIGTTKTAAAGKTYKLQVQISKEKPAKIWVVPRGIGEPMRAADVINLNSDYGGRSVEVWIEPTGGLWQRLTAPNDHKPLDLGIIAVHATLLSQGGGKILMWSPPRKYDANGNPVRRKDDPTQWEWDVFRLNDVEVRSLDVQSLETEDRAMDADDGPHKENIFCGGSAHLPDGTLFVAGGHIVPLEKAHPDEHGMKTTHNARHMYVYDPQATPAWTLVGAEMREYRWYPTVTALPDGRMLISAGTREVLEGNPDKDDKERGFWRSYCNNYEIYDPEAKALVTLARDSDLIDVQGIDLTRKESLATYPGVFVLPKPGTSGTVIAIAEGNRGWLYNYAPEADAQRPLVRDARMYRMRNLGSRSYPQYGAMVLLPFAAGETEMRILAVGGQDPSNKWRSLEYDGPATNTAEVLHVNTAENLNAQRGWERTAPMAYPRVLCDTTLLADGTVLVSGGSRQGWGDNNIGHIKDAELYDPGTGTFRVVAQAATDRRYHSTALLLPDGTVLKAGSTGGYGDGNGPDNKPWIQTHDDAELYYPPYLFRGPRPVIASVQLNDGADAAAEQDDTRPLVITYGRPFSISGSGGGIKADGWGEGGSGVAVARLGSTTHGNNMDQRYVRLGSTVELTDTGWQIASKAPANPATTPPGDYQLFVLDATGVPSAARFVRFALPG